MPKWLHNRAEHLLAKNPSMSKSMAFGIATQQSHALGKSPKGYGTPEGRREAKKKFSTPKDDKKTANPGGLESPKLASASLLSLREEFAKLSGYLHDRLRVPKTKDLGTAPPNPKFQVKMGFQTSQYSGPLGSGRMRYHSMIPPWHEPPVKTSGPPSEKKASLTGMLRPPSTGGGLTPAGRLRSAQGVGAPRASAPPGPSIAQISKPVGFGKPLPGATKTSA